LGNRVDAFAPQAFAVGTAQTARTRLPVCQLQLKRAALSLGAGFRKHAASLRMAAEEGSMSVDDLQLGSTYPGKVVSVVPFGAFVDIGCGTDGLLHVSELSDDFVSDVDSIVKIGDAVQVRVVDVSEGKGGRKKIAFSMRSVDAPRKSVGGRRKNEVPEALKNADPNEYIEGTVASITDFGAFITVAEGVDGLCHVSQLADARVERVEDVVSVGDTVRVRVISYDEQRGRLALSMIDL